MKASLSFLNALAGIAFLSENLRLASLIIFAITFFLFLKQFKPSFIKLQYFGVANIITSVRLLLILILTAGESFIERKYYIIPIVLIPLLDVLDGRIARMRKEESHFGMLYDMEVDALFVLVTSLIIYLERPVMWLVIFPAFLRYFYKIIIDILDKSSQFQEKKQRYASIIAGNYFIAIILYFLLSNKISDIYIIISSLLIILSFGKSFFEFSNWKIKNAIPS